MGKKKMDVTSMIIEYESGNLSDEDTIKLFQNLVDTGLAWRLQGHYGRTANAMIEAGLIRKPKKSTIENKTDFYGNNLNFWNR